MSKYAIFKQKSRAYTLGRKSSSHRSSKRKLTHNKTIIEHSTIATSSISASTSESGKKKTTMMRISTVKSQEKVIYKISSKFRKKTTRNLADIEDTDEPKPERITAEAGDTDNEKTDSGSVPIDEEDSPKGVESTARITTFIEEDDNGKKRRTSVLDPQLLSIAGNMVRIQHLDKEWDEQGSPHSGRSRGLASSPSTKWSPASPPTDADKGRSRFFREHTISQDKIGTDD